jgi:threonine dehydrogenase-like Zn-dependent dehydrogenase
MKALILKKYMELSYEDAPDPKPGDKDVLIKVKACGICGSDVHGLDGSTGRRLPPLIMGHEASGVIEALGPSVKGWKKGDRVTFDSTVYCGECWFCRRGEINLCDNRRVLGVSCEDYRQDGAFAEYIVVPQHILYRLPDSVSFEQAVLVEALSVAVHAVERTKICLGDSVAVVGAGMIGLLVIQALRIAGAGKIIAVDLDEGRLALAKNLGATTTLKSDAAGSPKAIRELCGGRGADCAFEVVGIAPTVDIAINSLRKGGKLTLVGNLAPSIAFPLQSIVMREITVYGCDASRGEYPVCLDLIGSRKIDTEAIISAVAPLSEGASWFKRLYNKEAGLLKVILEP